MDIEKIKSELKMEKLYFPESIVNRKKDIANGKLAMDLKKEIQKLEDNRYNVCLIFTIGKEAEDLFVKVVASADFLLNCDDENFAKNIIDNNTVAIMFPFLRSHVSLLTTQPNMSPIIIPPINTSKFVKN